MTAGEQGGTVLRVEGASDAPQSSALDSQLAKGGVDTSAFDKYTEDEGKVEGESLEFLRSLAQEQANCERGLQAAMAAVVKAKLALLDVQEKRLPELMAKHGLPKFEFVDKTTGMTRVIELVEKWAVSMPPKTGKTADPQWRTKHDAIFGWLKTIGKGSVVKKDFIAPLGLMDEERATQIMVDFKEKYPEVDAAFQQYVEPATLTALVSRMKDDGQTVNDFLNVRAVRESRVKG